MTPLLVALLCHVDALAALGIIAGTILAGSIIDADRRAQRRESHRRR